VTEIDEEPALPDISRNIHITDIKLKADWIFSGNYLMSVNKHDCLDGVFKNSEEFSINFS
jgi:hypothetical protein